MLRVKYLKQLNKKLTFCKSCKKKDLLARLLKLVFRYIRYIIKLLHKE